MRELVGGALAAEAAAGCSTGRAAPVASATSASKLCDRGGRSPAAMGQRRARCDPGREVAQAPASTHTAPRRPRLRLVSRLPAPSTAQRASRRCSCLAVRICVRNSRSRRKRSVLATSPSMSEGMVRRDMSITWVSGIGEVGIGKLAILVPSGASAASCCAAADSFRCRQKGNASPPGPGKSGELCRRMLGGERAAARPCAQRASPSTRDTGTPLGRQRWPVGLTDREPHPLRAGLLNSLRISALFGNSERTFATPGIFSNTPSGRCRGR
jgi:hypothetical protein